MNKPNEDNRLKGIKNAQDRKDYSIAFFNATNSAIALITPLIDRGTDVNAYKENIIELRDWFLEEHGKYRAIVTDKIGASYDVKDALGKLEATKTKEELEEVWRSFTQDERLDNELRAKCQELKKSYENI